MYTYLYICVNIYIYIYLYICNKDVISVSLNNMYFKDLKKTIMNKE